MESLYGWQVFDRILQRIAEALRRWAEESLRGETLLGLNGIAGDRFALFVPRRPAPRSGDSPSDSTESRELPELPEFPESKDPSAVDARYLSDLCSRIRDALERAFDADEFAGLNPRLEFRVGHALLSVDPFHRFERRVYAALDEARSQTERQRRRRQLGVDEDLRRVIEEPGLRTVFQPVVDLLSRRVHGYEALTRGPQDSPLEMPSAMFAISYRLGVATDLDHACREAALDACLRVSGPAKIFLNGLASSFETAPSDLTRWPRPLQRLARASHQIVLEFSERGADRDPESFVDTLQRLKACGFCVALDDIGTGFASQAILEQLRPDYLKLDVSLVRKIDQNLIKQELLQSLVRIANRMGASVIAEGVETEEEARALAEAGAHYGQGYLFAEPRARIGEPGGRVP